MSRDPKSPMPPADPDALVVRSTSSPGDGPSPCATPYGGHAGTPPMGRDVNGTNVGHPGGVHPTMGPTGPCSADRASMPSHGTAPAGEGTPRAPTPLPLPPQATDLRRAGRFPIEGLDCDLGKIMDLSATGMRLQRRLRLAPDKQHYAVLTDGEIALRLACIIRREVKQGMLTWEYGIEFGGVTEDIREALARFVFGARRRRTL